MPGEPIPAGLARPFALLRVAGAAVPGSIRQEWRREWEAEVWHAAMVLEARGLRGPRRQAELLRFASGAFRDAAAYWSGGPHRAEVLRALRHRAESPGFCLSAIGALIVLIVVASGFLPRTRTVLAPLPYRDAGRIATVAQGSARFATRFQVPLDWVRLWQQESKLIDGVAAYRWQTERFAAAGSEDEIRTAAVSDNFLPLLGARYRSGAPVELKDISACRDCVLLSYDFWSATFGGKETQGATLKLGGRTYRVAGVLAPEFWFLSKEIAAWRGVAPVYRDAEGRRVRAGAVVRLGRGVSEEAAEAELQAVLEAAGSPGWDSLVDVSPLQRRVRAVFGSFALGLTLAAVMVCVGLGLRHTSWNPIRLRRRQDRIRAAFFWSKVCLLLTAVLLGGLEFTRATRITMIGGTDTLTEPLSAYFFLTASLGALMWSIHDQRRRCRVCLRRLGLAAHVGCPGHLLLNWAGTELVCIEGHGILYVPEMVPCWQEPERWTSLDDSWTELFVRKTG